MFPLLLEDFSHDVVNTILIFHVPVLPSLPLEICQTLCSREILFVVGSTPFNASRYIGQRLD